MKSSKNIKVYGTLVNHTLDSTLADETHNDALMNAYQLFDGRFGDSPLSNNFQDVINKRITDITFDGGTTTIENRDEITENHYTLVVNGDTNLNGDVHITEDLHVDGDTHIGGDLYVTGDISGISLGDLDNVNKNADSASTGTFLKYNGIEWIPASIALQDMFGNIGDPFEGAILKYKNGAWTLTVDEDHDTNHLNDMADVNTSGIVNGSILKWNTSTNKWEIGSDLGSILPQGAEGKVLKYINGQWVAADDLTGGGTQLPEGSEGKVLKYINGSWVAADDNVGATKLSELSDVNSSVNSATDGQVLKFDASLNKWVAGEASGSGSTNISLEDLDNLNLDSAQDNDTIVYDSTAKVWKPSRFGTSNNVTYRTATVTYVKVAKHTMTSHSAIYGEDEKTSNMLFPGENDAYIYQLQTAPSLQQGEHVAYIEPGQSFNSINWSVAAYSTDLPLSRIYETQTLSEHNTINTVNGTEVEINALVNRYRIADAQYQSATKINNSSIFPLLKPVNSKGRIQNLLSSSSVYSIGVPSALGSSVTATSISQTSFITLENGKIVQYGYSANIESPYTTNYWKSIHSFGGNNQIEYITTTSIDQNTFLSAAGIGGTSSPITVDGQKLPFFFVASKDVTYPDTFEATVIIEQSALGMSYIGGLSINTIDVSTTVIEGQYYAILNMNSADAAKVVNIQCFYTDNGYIANPINTYQNQTSTIAVKYDQSNQRWISATAVGDCTCRFTYMSVK